MNQWIEDRLAPSSSEEMLALIRAFQKNIWPAEPADLKHLRQIRKPPMGNMPCILYASFNLFWLGESLQVWRSAAQNKNFPLETLSTAVSKIMERHALRLAKWELNDTLKVIRLLHRFFLDRVPGSHAECEEILGAALIAINRMQNWIDSVIPWSQMDKSLELFKPAE